MASPSATARRRQVRIANGGIFVNGRLAEFFELEKPRTGIESVDDPEAGTPVPVLIPERPGGRARGPSCRITRPVAGRRGPEHRKNEVGAFAHAPDAKRLPEVLGRFFESDFGRHVKEPGNAEGGIDEEAEKGADSLVGLALQKVVHRVRGFAEVVHRVRNPGLHEAGRPCNVGFSHRLCHRAVERIVEGIDVAVEGLIRINRVFARIGRDLRAPGKEKRGTERCPCGWPQYLLLHFLLPAVLSL